MAITHDRVQALLTSPIGAYLLDELERRSRARSGLPWSPFVALGDSDRAAVARAADGLGSTTPTELLELVFSAASNVGAWASEGPRNSAQVFSLAAERAPIADALAQRSDVVGWSAPSTPEQWWWTDHVPAGERRLGEGLAPFPAWATRPDHHVLTTSPLDLSLTDSLAFSWEMVFGPLSRWRLTAGPWTRVLEIDGPADWAALVARYPYDTSDFHGRRHASWELRRTGPGPDPADALLTVPGQRAARRGWRRVLTPDWQAVSEDWDGVHLTWFGFVTADGTITDLGDGDVTLLRHWGSERTVWLNPVLTDPAPMPAPPRSGRIGGSAAVSQAGRTPEVEERWLRTIACR